jgi:hypothetical protein
MQWSMSVNDYTTMFGLLHKIFDFSQGEKNMTKFCWLATSIWNWGPTFQIHSLLPSSENKFISTSASIMR